MATAAASWIGKRRREEEEEARDERPVLSEDDDNGSSDEWSDKDDEAEEDDHEAVGVSASIPYAAYYVAKSLSPPIEEDEEQKGDEEVEEPEEEQEDEDDASSDLTSSDVEDDEGQAASDADSSDSDDEAHYVGIASEEESELAYQVHTPTPSVHIVDAVSTQYVPPSSIPEGRRTTRSKTRAQSRSVKEVQQIPQNVATSVRKRTKKNIMITTAEKPAHVPASNTMSSDAVLAAERRSWFEKGLTKLDIPVLPDNFKFQTRRQVDAYIHSDSGVCCIGSTAEGKGRACTLKTLGCGATGLESAWAASLHFFLYHAEASPGKGCPWPGCESTLNSKPYKHMARHLCVVLCPLPGCNESFANHENLNNHRRSAHGLKAEEVPGPEAVRKRLEGLGWKKAMTSSDVADAGSDDKKPPKKKQRRE
ncbi:hypothetical protein EIP91_009044 [Steccherinum ochraceum]|uniref:C2H2-type domain-containing protein n=1 Tax=Steccherinum ochraceum TaxID=92696 RepID=A0A4R0R249_9APHY|nr:hypothetical protein EIP91_009044 [Steccherinum ochraceum]